MMALKNSFHQACPEVVLRHDIFRVLWSGGGDCSCRRYQRFMPARSCRLAPPRQTFARRWRPCAASGFASGR